MTQLYPGNYPVAPPDALPPGFLGNYPDGPPPAINLPPPPDPPAIRQVLFYRTPDNAYDVSWAEPWSKPLITEAMSIIEEVIELHPDNNYGIRCEKYIERASKINDNKNVIAACVPSAFASVPRVYTNITKYQLVVNLRWQNEFTQDQWVGIFVHELLHGIGFTDLSTNPQIADVVPITLLEARNDEGQGVLNERNYPDAVREYLQQYGKNGNAVPLSPNLGHIASVGDVVRFQRTDNPGFNSVMNATFGGELYEIDDVLLGFFKRFGYKVPDRIDRAGIQRTKFRLPKEFSCGHDHDHKHESY